MTASLLPPNASLLERALAEAAAPACADSAEAIRALWSPDTCPVELLPWLAWALSVDVWDDSWTESARRGAVRGSLAWHRKKGTPWAVKQMLAGIGFPDSTIVEHRALHQAWLDAGGELLDGTGTLNGSGDLAPPAGDFRFATTHWAEYALRLNVDDQHWTRARQREIIAVCRAYGPARSHLAAIILTSLARFDATIRLHGVAARGRARFADCRRFWVPGFDTLDGCDLIGGSSLPDRLDGLGALDGGDTINGLRPTGEPLDAAQLHIRSRGRARMDMGGAGGNRIEPPEPLDGGIYLDGRHTIAGPTLDGRELLDGAGDLFYPTLATPDDHLDGTSCLGEQPGIAGVWNNGRVRIRVGARTYLEPLQ